jgi:hypothetical protein
MITYSYTCECKKGEREGIECLDIWLEINVRWFEEKCRDGGDEATVLEHAGQSRFLYGHGDTCQ